MAVRILCVAVTVVAAPPGVHAQFEFLLGRFRKFAVKGLEVVFLVGGLDARCREKFGLFFRRLFVRQ